MLCGVGLVGSSGMEWGGVDGAVRDAQGRPGRYVTSSHKPKSSLSEQSLARPCGAEPSRVEHDAYLSRASRASC